MVRISLWCRYSDLSGRLSGVGGDWTDGRHDAIAKFPLRRELSCTSLSSTIQQAALIPICAVQIWIEFSIARTSALKCG